MQKGFLGIVFDVLSVVGSFGSKLQLLSLSQKKTSHNIQARTKVLMFMM